MEISAILQFVETIASLITALGIIYAALKVINKKINEPEKEKESLEEYKKDVKTRMESFDKRLNKIEKEQAFQTKTLLAIMDGLKQLGANGPVTDAKKELEQHLLDNAYDDGK